MEHYEVDRGLYTAVPTVYTFAMASMALQYTTSGYAELHRFPQWSQGLLMRALLLEPKVLMQASKL